MQSSEIDESVAAAYKLSLSRDSADWEEVCHKWKLTYSMRQKDLEKMGTLELLRMWPKLSHSRAPELIKIDFQTMYPEKDQLLFSKWETFKTKIGIYYEKNIHNDFCKQLFCNAKSSTNQDVQDYIFTILLNKILPSSTRFENNSGKRRKNVTMVDAQESFALRVHTINDYRRQIDIVIDKYYSAGLTVQPFLIVEGMSDVDIKGFYIVFNNNLLKCNSFIESVDICFKMFQVIKRMPTSLAIHPKILL